ncbi:MAG TPA: hypothetical protein VF644_03970 [Pyrinomonadaceae bacterium]
MTGKAAGRFTLLFAYKSVIYKEIIMAYLFHQNMLNFGGGADVRNEGYRQVLNEARAGSDKIILVAGFTEIKATATAPEQIQSFINRLIDKPVGNNNDPALIMVAAGQTIATLPEFVAIGVHPDMIINQIGRTYVRAGGGGVETVLDVAPNPLTNRWISNLPNDCNADSRGIVYVQITNKSKQSIVVGFVHNMYTFEVARSTFMTQIPKALNLIQKQCGGVDIFLGGDFNVPPEDREDRIYGNYYYYFEGLTLTPNEGVAFEPGGTTMAGSKYDYWYSNIKSGKRLPAPSVSGATLNKDKHLSDHCATFLKIS